MALGEEIQEWTRGKPSLVSIRQSPRLSRAKLLTDDLRADHSSGNQLIQSSVDKVSALRVHQFGKALPELTLENQKNLCAQLAKLIQEQKSLRKDEKLMAGSRLREASRKLRVQVIQSEIVLETTMCQTVAGELQCGHIEDARRLIGKIRHASESLRHRLSEPNHVPEHSLSGLLEQLKRLEQRIRDLESRLA